MENAGGRVGPRLSELPNLWAYARDLYQQDAFRATTRFDAFTAGGGSGGAAVDVQDWEEPVRRQLSVR